MIVVTAATGQLGHLVVNALLRKLPAREITAAVRAPERAMALADLGVHVKAADYDAPDTLVEAFTGADKVLLISSNALGSRATQHRAAIEAAQKAGVGRLVYTSVLHADTSALRLAVEHRDTERAIRDSGLTWTLLRNGWYVENYAQTVAEAARTGSFVGSAGDGRIAAATRADFADAAATVLTGDSHENKVYELAGDSDWSYADLAAEIATITGRTVSYQDVPGARHREILADAGLPAALVDLLVDTDRCIAVGGLTDSSGDLRALLGRPTTTLTEAVTALLSR
ncbi:MAG: SDR family oxidoreductase [Kutzneria sp.]|nr:SDR family oxidoreductase [Kutzneria sp.]